MQNKAHPFKRAQRYLLTGILTIIPLWITWVVLEFFLLRLSDAGRPWAQALASQLEHKHPELSALITTPWLQSIIAIVFIVVALYLLGWLTTLVIGRRTGAGCTSASPARATGACTSSVCRAG